jgi:hypothetical protein
MKAQFKNTGSVKFKLRKLLSVERFGRKAYQEMLKLHGRHLPSFGEFSRTCSGHMERESDNYFFKVCPFGELRLWKTSGRISVSSKLTVTNYNQLRTF